MTQFRSNQAELPVLWVDDMPKSMRNFAQVLRAEDSPLRIDTAESLGSALRMLEKTQYCSVVIDLELDPHQTEEDGASLLLGLNHEQPALPTFVYSGYLSDPRFSHRLKQSNYVLAESKTESPELPLRRTPLFQAIERHALRYQSVSWLCPESVPFSDYAREPEAFREHVSAHWRRHGHWISRELERRCAAWVVICGTAVQAAGGFLTDFPSDEQLHEIGEATGLVPFAYARPSIPEELRNGGKVHEHDYYPNLHVRINATDARDDFDTGAAVTCVSDSLIVRGLLNFFATYDSMHFGESFEFFVKQVRVQLLDASGVERQAQMPVQVVENWRQSPFTKYNADRNVLVGRDVLRFFKCAITINSDSRETHVQHL